MICAANSTAAVLLREAAKTTKKNMATFVKGSASSAEPTKATATAAAGGDAPASPTSYVAVILDITGSMGSQIQGVKNAVRELIPILAENPRLGVVIITFTEGGRCVRCRSPADDASVVRLDSMGPRDRLLLCKGASLSLVLVTPARVAWVLCLLY